MPADDDLGDIVTPDIRWAYLPTGLINRRDPPPPIEGDEAEPQVSKSSRRRTALGLTPAAQIWAVNGTRGKRRRANRHE